MCTEVSCANIYAYIYTRFSNWSNNDIDESIYGMFDINLEGW